MQGFPMQGWIDGVETASGAAVAAASALRAARNPLIVAGSVDLAGAAAALGLARRAGAALDHVQPMRLGPRQQTGYLGTTPGVIRAKADVILAIGAAAKPVAARLAGPNGAEIVEAGEDGERLLALLGRLRAALAGRPTSAPSERVLNLAEKLKSARYGVAIWDTNMPELAAESLFGLMNDLSRETRWTLLAAGEPEGQAELSRMSLALAGLPPPLAFAGQRAVFDPWRFDARRMVQRGETDLVLLADASKEPPPDFPRATPLILVSAHEQPVAGARIQIGAARPGVGRPGLLFRPDLGAIVAVPAQAPSTRPPLAAVLEAVAAALDAPADQAA